VFLKKEIIGMIGLLINTVIFICAYNEQNPGISISEIFFKGQAFAFCAFQKS